VTTSVAIARERSPAIRKRRELVKVTNSLLSTRSTIRPIGIAKRSHGNITSALIIEIRIGSFVSVIARSGAATANKPSDKLLMTLAPKRRLNALPSELVFNLSTYWVPTSGDHILGLIWSPCALKVRMYSGR